MPDAVRLGPLEFERDGHGLQINRVYDYDSHGETLTDGETVAWIESLSDEDWEGFWRAALNVPSDVLPDGKDLTDA